MRRQSLTTLDLLLDDLLFRGLGVRRHRAREVSVRVHLLLARFLAVSVRALVLSLRPGLAARARFRHHAD